MVRSRRCASSVLAAAALVLGGTIAALAQTASIDGAQLLRDLEILAADNMEGRLVGTPGSARAREHLVKRFKEVGIEPLGASYERPFSFKGRDGADRSGVNLFGVIRGRRDASHYIAVTAHYDHLGIRNGQVFNGADDNASGVAALLAAAARLAAEKPDHSVLLAAFDAEEGGLQGSRAFLRDPPVPREAILLNVNLDMVARDANNVLFASGTSHYPYLKPYLADVARPPVVLRFGHDTPPPAGTKPGTGQDDWTRDSDHFPFHEAGIPFVYFGVEDEEQHHKPTDDAETVTKEFFVGAANTILAAVRKLDANLDKIAQRQ
ncbi:MAG TPA: M20/M25/M40 family metallo-hydrolase [Vicinamibacterales bacterium]|nr:M20/M25/M40 family metallo-hydrolase [Vicinamibacterales bacterium]